MSAEIIRYIKSTLRSMYPIFKFEVTNSQDGITYNISVFKNTTILSTYSAISTTPRNVFWDNVKNWMKPIIANYR